ncbi:MAG: imidazole glycerol phosphate synthase subunit HisF [Clostridia bacterium]|nr:imidazole glycerol phosphate synthase subunit HisF [Clostridia bacterium]
MGMTDSARRIVACLDFNRGRVVKGVHFEGIRDIGNPAELAARYSESGADELAFLDISASGERRKTAIDEVRKVALRATVPLTVGGGIASVEDAADVLGAGASKVSMNTAAVSDPDLIARTVEAFGGDKVVLAIDATESLNGRGWEVCINGGRTRTGIDAVEWAARGALLGAGEILLTSIMADGARSGYDIALTRAVADAAGVPVVASGGAGSLEDFVRVLTDGGASAALAASVLHLGILTIHQIKEHLRENGVPTRQ